MLFRKGFDFLKFGFNPLNSSSVVYFLNWFSSEVAGYSQPMSTEYLLLTEEEEQEKEEKEGGSLGSRDSMYEMGSLMDSLSHSVEHLDTQVSLCSLHTHF